MGALGSKARGWTALAAAATLVGTDPATADMAKDAALWWSTAPKVRTESYQQEMCGFLTVPKVLVANSAAEWDSLTGCLAQEGAVLGGCAPRASELGDVDWTRHSVVLVGLGECTTAQWRVRVNEVRRHGQWLLLDVRVEQVSSGYAPMSMTTPYHMVLVDQRDWAGALALYDRAVNQGDGARRGLGVRESGEGAAASTADASGAAARTTAVRWSELKDRYR